MSVTNMEAKRATYAELDLQLLDRMNDAQSYIEQGIDIAKQTHGIVDDESDGLASLRRTLIEAQKRIKQLSPYLGN